MADKNPYPSTHPRWGMWETIKSQELLVISHTKDAERYAALAAAARLKGEAYREELAALESVRPYTDGADG